MRAFLLGALLGLVMEGPMLTDEADIIEINHYYDERGKHVFDQVIFWEWRAEESAYRVIAWRFLKRPYEISLRDPYRGDYTFRWADDDRLRQVRAPWFRETWTQYDPEVNDRRFFAQTLRRGLTGTCRDSPVTQR